MSINRKSEQTISGEDYQMSLEMFNKNIPKNFTPEYGLTTTTTGYEKYTHQWTRHYPVKEEQEKVMEDMLDIHNSYDNHNSSNSGGETDDPLKQYTIQYVDDDNDDDDDYDNNDPCYNDEDVCRENKGYRTFLVADYVDYNQETNMSKCLIINCEKPMSGRRTGNIKRHYEKVHNFVIVHRNNKDKEKLTDETASQPACITVNLDKYFDYDPLTNKSYCKMPGCNAALVSRKPNNIMRHYSLVHNFKIGAEETNKEVTKSDSSRANKEPINIPLEDLVAFDGENNKAHCLFITCSELLEKDILKVERHYNEAHKVVIARNGQNVPNRFYRKRIYRYIHQPFENDQEYVENKLREYLQQTDVFNIKQEQEDQPHCSKQINKPLMPLGKMGFGKFILQNYVDYDQLKNVSKCLIKHCKRSMSGCLAGNIKRHYLTMHNFVILHGSRIPFEEIEEMSDVRREQIEDLVAYDKNSTYQCLFMNCGVNLEDNLFTIKKHYLEIHKIIIIRYSDYIVQRKRRYRELQQQQLSEMEFYNEEATTTLGSDDDETQQTKTIDQDTEMEMEKVNYGKMRVERYVDYNQEKNLSKCLIKHCKRSMSGCLVGNIKRHYLTMHNFVILHGLRSPYQESKDKPSTKVDLLPFYMEISSQQCLFINCNQTLEKDLSLVRNHYHEVHKIIINKESYKMAMPTLYRGKALPATVSHRNQESILPDEEEENRNLSLMEQNLYSSTIRSMVLSLGRRSIGKFNMSQYVDYDKEKNLAKCLIRHCKRSMSGCIVGNIKRHYKRMHNFVILHGIRLPNEEFQEIFDTSIIDELVAFDIESSSFQCIFNNCSQVLEKDLPSLKIHYCKVHQVAIAKDPECGIKRKLPRRYHELYETSFETEFLEEESCSVRNEYLSEEDDPTNYLEESMNCPIKKEYISDDDDDDIKKAKQTFPIITENPLENKQILPPSTVNVNNTILNPLSTGSKENSTTVNIDLTKQSFLNLCLGLVIERDMPLHYFDDDKYFKTLLAPYEQVFGCNINATKMRNIMLKANHLIVEQLSKRFSNKILCLELYILKRFGSYYMIINVRFLEEEIICNKLIGSFAITASIQLLPLNKYLKKFSIDEQQVYMKTIMPEFHNDEEIYKICDNICKHNPDIKNHPIYELQTIFTSFIKKYSPDIKNWQTQSGHKETVLLKKNISENLKEFSEYLEKNCAENEEQLLPAKHFFKALQIFWNFMDKLSGEQYVSGDFYRDLLCCELGLKGEHNKSQNSYAKELYEEFCNFKNRILESREFVAALYLDARFNFLGTRLIGDNEQIKGKLFLCEIWDKFKTYLQLSESPDNTLSNTELNNEEFNDDEYALLTQHINDTMPVKTNVSIQHKLSNFVPTKRQPISMDILKYWHSNCQSMEDINELTKIAFTHSASQFILLYLETNFSISLFAEDEDEFDKLLIKSNQELLEANIVLILEDL
ncbi:uncharacterized protein LOC119603254 [Lucilia sericata]|uniref:uncharacterized protein LOC119603254 n=1 Tax=Lucilia sericata TaxID=13632 RepID=UPI0018A881A1|nr:uncharacterized protein LOC119603254 [Lucilia sericata]